MLVVEPIWYSCTVLYLYFCGLLELQTSNSINVFDMQPKVKKVKKVAPAPYTTSKPVPKKVINPLIEKRPRNFGIGKNKSHLIDLLSC